jgi:hypothetical protein
MVSGGVRVNFCCEMIAWVICVKISAAQKGQEVGLLRPLKIFRFSRACED